MSRAMVRAVPGRGWGRSPRPGGRSGAGRDAGVTTDWRAEGLS